MGVGWFFFYNVLRGRGEPLAWVSPLFSGAENSPFPALWEAQGISPSADGDQGLCPWTLVAFVKAPQNLIGSAALVSRNALQSSLKNIPII